MKWTLHLLAFALTSALLIWAEWLANSRRPTKSVAQSFRVVMPYRIQISLMTPFLLWASWHEWGQPVGAFFLIIAFGCIPLAVYFITIRVTLDSETIRLQHAFADKRIRFSEIKRLKFREWHRDYVVYGGGGVKIVFPTVLERASYVFEQCRSTGKLD